MDIKENTNYLEKNILEHLKELLLELGNIGNQVRLTLGEDHFYPDLVLYNRLLKCFVIIDLKMGKVTANKNETIVKYTLPEDNKTIFSFNRTRIN